jgi:hypothetical protein
VPTLTCKRVIFYSQGDEAAFFNWISRIKAIKTVKGVGDEIRLVVPRRRISAESLRDLLALFFRYKVDMGQLSTFATPENGEWFKNPKMYWHRKVFLKT